LLLFVAENAEQMFGDPLLRHYLRFMQLSPWPPVHDPTLQILDLSAGLLLVALSEGLVFRRFLFAVIERRVTEKVPVIILSSAAFALVQFTSGVVDTMVNAFVHAIFLGTAFRATRRVAICVVSHYLIDLYVGIGP
jgi:membrane protease YdiL (CAAX protease family)